MTPRTIVLLGKSGSGKDTQAKLVAEKLQPFLYISTGDLGRALMKSPTAFGHKVKETLEKGGIFPDWLASYLWEKDLAERLQGEENIVFPSSPRKIGEAEKIDTVLEWLGRRAAEAVLIDISDDEAVKRLLGRGRADDTEENIRERLSWFEPEVSPTIRYYEERGRLYRIDGVGTVKEIFNRIKEVLKL